jgi:hypothetical protein
MVNLAVHSTGTLLVPTVFAIEKRTSGNQIMRMIRKSKNPPQPYFSSARFLTPLGEG